MSRALLLLLSVGAAHFGYDWLASGPVSARWWFYGLRGIEGAVLCALLLPGFRYVPMPWSAIGIFAAWLGFFEETKTAVCSVTAFGSTQFVPAFSGICGQWSPYYNALEIAGLAFVTLWMIRRAP